MPTALPILPRPIAGARTRSGLVRPLVAAFRLWSRWHERHRQRCALGDLDDRLLDDVGLTRRQADEERHKPPWR